MSRPTRTLAPPSAKSADRLELEALVAKVSPTGRVDAFENGNGHVVCVEFARADKRVARLYCEGASTLAGAERSVLAALKALVQS